MAESKEFKRGEDFIGNCVVFFCHDGNGNVVMSKRGQNSRDEKGVWDIGGGAIEFGDSIENTLRQEISQEYQTDVLKFEFLGYRDVHRINDGKPTHWIALDFKVLIDPKKVKNGEPHKFDDVQMFPANNLPKQVHSQFPLFLDLYKEKLGI